MLLADYADYVASQEKASQLYRSPQAWMTKAILNVAGMGRFSTDRTIREYAETIWGVKPSPRPLGA
jgi:starch phosphorylase